MGYGSKFQRPGGGRGSRQCGDLIAINPWLRHSAHGLMENYCSRGFSIRKHHWEMKTPALLLPSQGFAAEFHRFCSEWGWIYRENSPRKLSCLPMEFQPFLVSRLPSVLPVWLSTGIIPLCSSGSVRESWNGLVLKGF